MAKEPFDLYDNDYVGKIFYTKKADLQPSEPEGFCVSQPAWKAIFACGNKPLRELIEKENLFVFPASCTKTQEALLELPLFTTQIIEPEKVLRVKTGNLMGFVGFNGIELQIRSRFSKDAANNEDYFLYYMLQKVCVLNGTSLQHQASNTTNALDLLKFLFPRLLNEALSQGIYREYRSFHYNDNRVRGVINVNKYIKCDIPFQGNIAYRTREYAADNSITQLIRHTIELLRHDQWGRMLLNNDTDTRISVQKITNVTPSYQPRMRKTVIQQNLKTICHPYYTKYRQLQALCLRLLRHERISYGADKDKINGILFDGAWLWEEYLATLLRPIGFTHPQNKERTGKIFLFADNKEHCFPDFYNDTCVADAKYKRLGKGVERPDLYQMVTYLHIMERNKGIYICPDNVQECNLGTLNGMGGELYVLGMNIPSETKDFTTFSERMVQQEKLLIENYKHIITNN